MIQGEWTVKKICIEHRDHPEDIVEKINEALKGQDLVLKYVDEESGDGFVTYELTSLSLTAK